MENSENSGQLPGFRHFVKGNLKGGLGYTGELSVDTCSTETGSCESWVFFDPVLSKSDPLSKLETLRLKKWVVEAVEAILLGHFYHDQLLGFKRGSDSFSKMELAQGWNSSFKGDFFSNHDAYLLWSSATLSCPCLCLPSKVLLRWHVWIMSRGA